MAMMEGISMDIIAKVDVNIVDMYRGKLR